MTTKSDESSQEREGEKRRRRSETKPTGESTEHVTFTIPLVSWTITLPKGEHVTTSERKLWKFLHIPDGKFCELFGFEEPPYYLLFLQIFVSEVVLAIFNKLGAIIKSKLGRVDNEIE